MLYLIGDIQGCFSQLKRLLKLIQFNTDKDQLWLCGDLVNRGPDSLAVLAYLHSIKDNCRITLGNHDFHFLASYHQRHRLSRKDTLQPLLDDTNCKEYIDWLRLQPLIQYDEARQLIMVHAAVCPSWTIEQALSYNQEVTTILKDSSYPTLLANMYADEPKQWHDQLTGYQRLRTIINYFTRLRVLDDHQNMVLNYKKSWSDLHANCTAWFEQLQPSWHNYTIAFGHWAALYKDWPMIKQKSILPLDSGCVWGGKLSAYCWENKQYLQI